MFGGIVLLASDWAIVILPLNGVELVLFEGENVALIWFKK
jgi:hypothetical protein